MRRYSRQWWARLSVAGVALALAACGAGTGGAAKPAAIGGGQATGAAPATGGAGPGAAPASAPPASLRDVRTSYPSAAATFGPLWAAHEYGIFEQYGLRSSEPQLISGGPANAQTLVAREVHASYTAFSPMLAANMGGAPVKAVAGFGRGFVHHLFTKAGSGVASAQDMRGKRAGVSRIGTESHTVIRQWARKYGVRDDEITYVNAGTVGERLAGLEGGIIELAPLDPPVVIVAEKRGFVRVADLSRENLPWQRESLVMLEDTIRAEPAFAANVVRAVAEASYLLRSDRQRFDEVVGKYIKVDDPDALGAAYASSVFGSNHRGRPSEADVKAVQEAIEDEMPGTVREPVSRFVDFGILDQLEREGFFDRLEQQYPIPALQ
jgi:ABC-type nitrate/sulfonate/bicarbonate transport system substrate-binding protein